MQQRKRSEKKKGQASKKEIKQMIYGIVKKRVKRKTKELEYKDKNCTKRKREIKKSYWRWRKK